MLYDIRLRMAYDYDRPVIGGRHHIRVIPRMITGRQRVTAASLSIDPQPAERSELADFYRNIVTSIAFRNVHNDLRLAMSARVAVEHLDEGFDVSPDVAGLKREIAAHLSLGPDSPHHFLVPSPLVEADEAIAVYARETQLHGVSVMAIATELCMRINGDFTYDSTVTDVTTPPRRAFDLRRGVCQDFAHIMIAGLRGLGIPASYVSGYLRTIPPAGAEPLEGADGMHAWVRAWCGEQIGWLELDPTNAMRAGEDHIVVGFGRDYSDVAPIAGMLRTLGNQEGMQAVDVIPAASSVHL
jgi:transglutaminase-like putative cysteine protease